MAEFQFIGYLAEVIGEREKEIVLEKPRKLRDILGMELSEERTIVLINQKAGTFDSVIQNGDKVAILPIISGG
jgi:molybdopterin converting factor small subunit